MLHAYRVRAAKAAAFTWELCDMTFKYSFTFPISGPNKLPRFKKWVADHAKDVEVSLPPQVPVKSEAMTVRLKSADDRGMLQAKLAGAEL